MVMVSAGLGSTGTGSCLAAEAGEVAADPGDLCGRHVLQRDLQGAKLVLVHGAGQNIQV